MTEIIVGKSDFQFTHLEEELEPCIANIFKHNKSHNVVIKTKLDLREVILVDIQLTMDLF